MVTSLNFIKLLHDNIMRLIKCWTALFSNIDHSKVARHTFCNLYGSNILFLSSYIYLTCSLGHIN